MVVVFALIPVVLGTVFGLIPWISRPLLGPMRTLALVAALTVVFAELLPESVESIGAIALVVFLLGFLGPIFMERAMRWVGSQAMRRHGLALELGYVGLFAHQCLDGAQIAGADLLAEGSGVVTFAIAAHATPLVLVTILGYAAHDGFRAAAVRALGLAIGSVIGVMSIGVLGGWLTIGQPWLAAGIAGVLLNILTHDLDSDLPRNPLARAADLTATVLGVLIPLSILPHAHAGGGHVDLVEGLTALSLQTAPMLMIGLMLGVALRAMVMGASDRHRLILGGVGAPLPICACGILPTARMLSQRGVKAAVVVGFVIAIPGLGLETLTISIELLGWKFAVVRLIGVLIVSVASGLAVGLVVDRVQPQPSDTVGVDQVPGGFVRRVVHLFDEAMLHVSPWITVGVVLAAYVSAHLASEQLTTVPTGLHLMVMGLLSFPVYVCAASATPLAGVLLAKGLSPGAAMMGLLLGPAVNVAAVGFLFARYGRRATWCGLTALCLATLLVSLVSQWVFSEMSPVVPDVVSGHESGALSMTLTALAGLFVLRSLWRLGFRGWLVDLISAAGGDQPHGDGHRHEHAAGHTHHH